jgi:hypothetical protein
MALQGLFQDPVHPGPFQKKAIDRIYGFTLKIALGHFFPCLGQR